MKARPKPMIKQSRAPKYAKTVLETFWNIMLKFPPKIIQFQQRIVIQGFKTFQGKSSKDENELQPSNTNTNSYNVSCNHIIISIFNSIFWTEILQNVKFTFCLSYINRFYPDKRSEHCNSQQGYFNKVLYFKVLSL